MIPIARCAARCHPTGSSRSFWNGSAALHLSDSRTFRHSAAEYLSDTLTSSNASVGPTTSHFASDHEPSRHSCWSSDGPARGGLSRHANCSRASRHTELDERLRANRRSGLRPASTAEHDRRASFGGGADAFAFLDPEISGAVLLGFSRRTLRTPKPPLAGSTTCSIYFVASSDRSRLTPSCS